MKKLKIQVSAFIIVVTTIASSINLSAQDINKAENDMAIKRTIMCPQKVSEDINVTITIYPKMIKSMSEGYQRLTEIIPEGFNAICDNSDNSKAVNKEGKMIFYWTSKNLQDADTITLKYHLNYNGKEDLKNIILMGSFDYTLLNEKRVIYINGDNTCNF